MSRPDVVFGKIGDNYRTKTQRLSKCIIQFKSLRRSCIDVDRGISCTLQ